MIAGQPPSRHDSNQAPTRPKPKTPRKPSYAVYPLVYPPCRSRCDANTPFPPVERAALSANTKSMEVQLGACAELLRKVLGSGGEQAAKGQNEVVVIATSASSAPSEGAPGAGRPAPAGPPPGPQHLPRPLAQQGREGEQGEGEVGEGRQLSREEQCSGGGKLKQRSPLCV